MKEKEVTMLGERDINGYCDHVFKELTDIKQKISKIEENAEDLPAEDKKAVSDNIVILLDELSEQVDSKLHSIITYCPAIREKTRGASKWVSEFHPAGSS
jgi:archaellum component FlaC